MSQYHGKNWNSGRGRIANPRHRPDEQSIAEQTREREALSRLEAPFPVRDPQMPHDPFDCPDPDGLHCEEARRREIHRARLGIPGLSPEPTGFDDLGLAAGEPLPLVDQSKKREQDLRGGTLTFTPGPWRLNGLAVEADDPVTPGRTVVVAEVTGHPANGIAQADARFIAATPDLYNAVVTVWANLGGDPTGPLFWLAGVCRDAIAIATGEPS